MDAVVVSVGGSIFQGPEGPDSARTLSLALLLNQAAERAAPVFIVVGGGETARRYIEAARELGENEGALDELGIMITRANARLLLSALPDAYPAIPRSFDEAILASKSHKIVLMGGTHAGHTTDAVAAMLAERARASHLVISTNVRGVFSADPKASPRAKFLPRISSSKLVEITIQATQQAGSKGVVDPVAAKIIHRSSVPTLVVDGRNQKELTKSLHTLGPNEYRNAFQFALQLKVNTMLKKTGKQEVAPYVEAARQNYQKYLRGIDVEMASLPHLAYWLHSQKLFEFMGKQEFDGTIVEPEKP